MIQVEYYHIIEVSSNVIFVLLFCAQICLDEKKQVKIIPNY